MVHLARHAVRLADVLFTLPGVLLLVVNGLVLTPAAGIVGDADVNWLIGALTLLGITGLIWGGCLIRWLNRYLV